MLPTFLIAFGLSVSGSPPAQVTPCDDLYGRLDAIAHTSLERRTGPVESVWRGEPPAVCEVSFETNEATLAGARAPDFWAEPDNEMYRAGWRMIPEILADGAGSGIYGIQRAGARCVIQWEQPAYVDDDGNIVQSDTFTMLVQCGTGG